MIGITNIPDRELSMLEAKSLRQRDASSGSQILRPDASSIGLASRCYASRRAAAHTEKPTRYNFGGATCFDIRWGT
jgi:hypothetical protein